MVSISDIAYNYPLNVIMKHNITQQKLKSVVTKGFKFLEMFLKRSKKIEK